MALLLTNQEKGKKRTSFFPIRRLSLHQSSVSSPTLVTTTFVSTLDIEMVQNMLENRDKGQGERRKSTLKAVIRHLPPSMTASEFISAVEPLPDHNFFWFEEADTSLGQYAFSRSYINFKERDDIELFTDKFDGYVFVDSKGNDFPASVEFAPFQKIPKLRILASETKPKVTSRDPKVGTIEEDPDYLAFLDSLKETESNLPSAEIYLEEMEKKAKELKDNHGCPKVLTPLLEFVLNKKSESTRQIQEAKNPRRESTRQIQEAKNPRRESTRQIQEAKNPRREKGRKQKGQEGSKTKVDSKPSRKDRRRERDRREGEEIGMKKVIKDRREGEEIGMKKVIKDRREEEGSGMQKVIKDRREGEGSGMQKVVEKAKERQSMKLLRRNEGRNLVANKPLAKKDLSKLDKHSESRTSIIEPIKIPIEQIKIPIEQIKIPVEQIKIPIEQIKIPVEPTRDSKSVNNERQETELKKPITGKSHASSSLPFKARRDGRRGDERKDERRDERKGDERRRNDRRDVKKDVNRDEKREEKREKKQDRDKKREGNRDVEKEGNIGEKREEKSESKNVERKDECRKEEREVKKENEKSSPSGREGRRSSERRDRVRNKDRPDIPRYQPKIRTDPSQGTIDGEDRRDPASSNQGSRKVRTKVFTRTRKPEN